MSQKSPVTITWERGPSDSVVLVTAGGWIGGPMVAAGKQDVFEKPGMGVAEAYFRALGGAVVEVKITLEEDKESLADALAAHIDLEAGWIGLDGKLGTLTIAAEDESWTLVFHPCVLGPFASSLPGGTGAATVRRTLQFVSHPPIYTETEE